MQEDEQQFERPEFRIWSPVSEMNPLFTEFKHPKKSLCNSSSFIYTVHSKTQEQVLYTDKEKH